MFASAGMAITWCLSLVMAAFTGHRGAQIGAARPTAVEPETARPRSFPPAGSRVCGPRLGKPQKIRFIPAPRQSAPKGRRMGVATKPSRIALASPRPRIMATMPKRGPQPRHVWMEQKLPIVRRLAATIIPLNTVRPPIPDDMALLPAAA